ncbi:hypothetical protein B4Q13_19115 [Lacticaseibacillus rhamnosus]
MLCEVCKEADAVIQLTVSSGSGVTQLHLCEKCAAERGVEDQDAVRVGHGMLPMQAAPGSPVP